MATVEVDQDLIVGLAGITGVTIRVRHELPEASMRLMRTLGVTVVIDAAADDCVRINERAGVVQRCRKCAALDRGEYG